MRKLELTQEDLDYLNYLIYSLKMGLVRSIESNPSNSILLKKQGLKVYQKYQNKLCYLSTPLVFTFFTEVLSETEGVKSKDAVVRRILSKQQITLPKPLITGWKAGKTHFTPQRGVKLKIMGNYSSNIQLKKQDSGWYLV